MAGIPNRNVAHRRSAVEGLVRRHGRTFRGRKITGSTARQMMWVQGKDITAKKAMPDGCSMEIRK